MNAIKKIFKLIRLGVFCKWFTNVNKQPDLRGRSVIFKLKYIISLLRIERWSMFVSASFIPNNTEK